MRAPLAIVSGLVLAVQSCGSDEPTRAASSVPDASHDASPRKDAGSAGAPALDAATPKRTLITRNPFGNVAASDNLLWDGDFEWHSPFASQYGWVYTGITIGAGGFSGVRIGPDCKSGMKCGVLTQNQKVAAIGVSPTNRLVHASVWTRPSTGLCGDGRVLLIPCDWGVDPDLPVVDADGKPDSAGWCEHVIIAEKRERASCLLIEATFDVGELIIDDAVVRAAPEGATPTDGALVPSPEISAAAESARASLRDWLRPGRVRDSDARRAFEDFRRRSR